VPFDPITAIAETVNTVLSRVLPDKTAQDAAKAQLVSQEVQDAFNQVVSQIQVNAVEAASPSVFVAGWRPFIGWICGSGLGYDFLFRPIANGIVAIWHIAPMFQSLDLGTMLPLLFGMLGLGAMRTAEKIQGASGSDKLQ
jgi:hypothetical protein